MHLPKIRVHFLLKQKIMAKDVMAEIAKELGTALSPLRDALQSKANFKLFMKDLGWEVDDIPQSFKNLKPSLDAIKSLSDIDELNASTVQQLCGQIKNLIESIQEFAHTPQNFFPNTNKNNIFKDVFPKELLEYLAVQYLQEKKDKLAAILRIIGVIQEETIDATMYQLKYLKKSIHWEDIPQILEDPMAVFKKAYDWNNSGFKEADFRKAIRALGESLGFPMKEEELSDRVKNLLGLPESIPKAYKLTLVDRPQVSSPIGILFTTLPATTEKNYGFGIIPFAGEKVKNTFKIDGRDNLKVHVAYDYNMAKGIGVFVRPNDVKIKTEIETDSPSDNPPSALDLKIGLEYQNENKAPMIVLGKENESRLEFLNLLVNLRARVGSDKKHEFLVESALNGGKVVIKAGENDGFLKTLLPKDGIEGSFDVLVGWSAKNGVYFEGSGGLDLEIPLHINLYGLEINGLKISLDPKTLKIPIDIGTNFKAHLGPMVALVENMGLKSNFTFPSDQSGNLGPLNYDLKFKPPNGIGLSIDTGVIKGGGYLNFFPEKGEYSGAMELTFSEIISMKAVGVINTKMPDGSAGFSMIIVITTEFGTGIQLGFGFTLLSVGGLLGLNRTMRLDALAEGVRTGSVERIMFPTNVVENAPRIISDLKNFFPIEKGKYLIGPMAKLGWGTPTLMSISLGVIMEVPGNIAILGVMKIALPTADAALIVMQVNFIGAIEFDKSRLWFFASLYDSRVLYITMEGEMALLVAWGNDPNFVASVGGFHPNFNPPTLPFSTPKRISLSILNTSVAKIRVLGYFAVTSNTAQFGARAELYFGFSALSASGHVSFDALFQFSPFYMIIQASASLSVKVFGAGLFSIHLKLTLEGPTPWKARGNASITLLFFDVSVDINKTWGDKKDTSLPNIEVMPLLVTELEKQENWKAFIPSNNKLYVSLRKIDSMADLVLHPLGTLQLSQKAIPLEMDLDVVGAQKPKDANHFTVEPNSSELNRSKSLKEMFAIGQFKNLSQTEKLSSPSYQSIDSGLELSISGEQFKTGKTVKRHIRYELVIMDSNHKRMVLLFFVGIKTLFTNFLKGNTVAKSAISNQTFKKRQPFEERIQMRPMGFAVANKANNKLFTTQAKFTSHAQAMDYMKGQINKNPSLAGSLHVLPLTETTDAA